MKPLETHQNVLTSLWMLPLDEGTSLRKRIACVAFGISTFLANLAGLMASVAFISNFKKNDLAGTLYAFFHMFGFLTTTYSIFVAFFLRHQMSDVFRKLAEIYDAYKNEDSFRFLAQANNNSEKLWAFYFKFLIGAAIHYTSMPICSIIFCWLKNGVLDTNKFYYPYKLILPWNQGTLHGYLSEVCFDTIVTQAFFLTNGALLLMFLSMCTHYEAFYKRFRYSLGKLEHLDQNRNDEKFLSNLVRFHVEIKDLFWVSAEVCSPFLMIQLLCQTMSLACTVFQIDMQFKHLDFGLAMLLLAFVFLTAILFLYCFLGKIATENCGKMADCVYESNWQDLSVNLQKYIILMIGNAQQPLFYHGFGMINLDLGTFNRLLRAVFTYYMMFKTVTSK